MVTSSVTELSPNLNLPAYLRAYILRDYGGADPSTSIDSHREQPPK
jgi:hypothetical protein